MNAVSRSFDLPDIDSFLSGTIGDAGQRVFYLQAVAGGEVISLKIEKQQLGALVDYLDAMLQDLDSSRLGEVPEPQPLRSPVEAEWAVASMGVAYVESRDRIALWTEELVASENPNPANGRFQLTRAQVTAFVRDSRELISAGRPPCPYCGAPLSDGQQWCPCWN